MDAMPYKTKAARILDILLIAGFFCLVFVLSLRRLSDYDLWGHLKAGEYLFKTGSILTTHYFNCSWPEFPYLNHEWLFQAITYRLYVSGGEISLVSLQLLLLMLSFFILYKTARLYSDNIPVIVFVLALGVLASSHRFVLRPQHFSYVFLLINLFSLHQYSRGRTQYLYILPVVMLLWVNIHAESTWGLVVPFIFLVIEAVRVYLTKEFISKAPSPSPSRGEGYKVSPPLRGGDEGEGDLCDFTNDRISKKEDTAGLKKLTIVFILIAAASLINPFTYKTVIWPLLVMSEQFAGVEELLAPTELRYLPFWIYFGIFVIAVIFSFRRIKIHFLFIALFFSVIAWIANRGIPHFVFASAPVIVAGLSGISSLATRRHKLSSSLVEDRTAQDIKSKEGFRIQPSQPLRRSMPGRNDKINYLLRLLLLSLIAAAIFFIVTDRRYLRKFDNVPYPEGAVKFIKDKEIKGNMFNLHGWGGYLVWELYPSVKVYIDNRFFHRKFFAEYEKILSGEMEWQELLNKYKINIVLLNYSPSDAVNLRDHLFRSSDWRLAYWDDYSLLYLKNEAGFKDINDEYSMRIVNPDTYRFRPYGLERTILMSASEEVRKNIENAENSWTARFMLGNIMYSLGDAGGASSNFKDAIRLSPDQSPAIYFNLGQAYMAAGRLADAEESFKEVIKLEPVAEAYQALRRVYLLQGKNKEAEVIFKKHLREK
ncbi:MAG: hypothetical protein FD156_62 [Nitrospirae bacterium]|nr:MAG: hypothetical protein FD156_62 [Nitrospirota bacterium]